MLQYKQYKAINIPWLTEIPAHWNIQRNKTVFSEMKEEVGKNAKQYRLLSLTLNGIIPRDMEAGGKFPESFDKYKIVKPGYMAFCLFDVDETPRTVGLSQYDGMLTGAYTIMQVHDINPRYAYYYYLSLDNQKKLRPLYAGLRKTINVNTFQSAKLPVPPREEQEQIVRFLDWKVSAINRLIANNRHRIELLESIKQKIIDRAVIKSATNVPIVHNDDIRWPIDYPKHWKIQRLKESFAFRKGLSITKADLEETGIAVISYGQVHSKSNSGFGLNPNLIRYVNESYLATNKSSLVTKGDFIFADTSEDIAGCGNCVYIDWDDTIFAGYHSIIAHPATPINSQYLAYLFQSQTWRWQIHKKVNGVKVYSITQKMLKDTFILLPPVEDQKEIIAYLGKTCKRIDEAVEKTNDKIKILQELKPRLISDVVTGKIDVRGVEVPEYEYVDETPETEDSEIAEDEEQEADV